MIKIFETMLDYYIVYITVTDININSLIHYSFYILQLVHCEGFKLVVRLWLSIIYLH